MKQALLLLSILLSLTAAHGQPTHTFTFDPGLLGSPLTFSFANALDPGPSGADQTWDFSTMITFQPQEGSLEDPANTPYSGQYPDADFAGFFPDAFGDQYVMYDYRSDGVYTLGLEFDGFLSQPYSDARRDLATPLTYQQNYSDSAYFESNTFGFTSTGASNYVVEVDGYGTLITPFGTYENVLRLHSVETTEIVFDPGIGEPVITETIIDTYAWLIDEYPIPILLTFDQTTDGQPDGGSARVLSGLSTFTTEANHLEGVSLYPVPAVDFVTLDLGQNEITRAEVRLFDVRGSLLKSFRQNQVARQIRIDVNDLPAGLYSVQIVAEEGMTTKRFIK